MAVHFFLLLLFLYYVTFPTLSRTVSDFGLHRIRADWRHRWWNDQPIIAIGAAFLTFLAFWMQYKANRQQRDDISLERFESNLYEMLHLHRENLFDLSCGKSNGRNAVLALCYKLKILYYLIDSIIELWPEPDKKLFLYYCDKYNYSQSEAKNIIASNLLFYGANFSYSYDGKSNERKLYDKLSRVIENFESNRTKNFK